MVLFVSESILQAAATTRSRSSARLEGSEKKVFSYGIENDLASFLAEKADILSPLSGLSDYEVQQFTFQYALTRQLKMPQSWVKNESADIEWCKAFLKRHHQPISVDNPNRVIINRMKMRQIKQENERKEREKMNNITRVSKKIKESGGLDQGDATCCLYCADSFRNSKRNELWIKCVTCHCWAHEDCSDKTHQNNMYKMYKCEYCLRYD